MKDLWALGVLGVLAFATADAENKGAGVDQTQAPEVVYGETIPEKLLQHSVTIIYENGSSSQMGSGVLFKNGNKCYVLTAQHVVGDGLGRAVIMSTGLGSDVPDFIWGGFVVAKNEKIDAAIIELINADPVTINGAAFQRQIPKVGQEIYAIGNPAGEINMVTEGIISHNRRIVEWCSDRHLQITANGSFGSSGGGVFTADTGKCVGLVVRINRLSNIMFVVPMKAIMDWMVQENLISLCPTSS
jgi:S1-C subfamily serine protease